MTYPKPKWIRYKVELNDAYWVQIYIYAHGEQMVREILDDYLVTKIERMDKDG
jgi:hypothetical protein